MSYSWNNAEQTTLKYEDGDQTLFIPAAPANRHYAEFLASGATAATYVKPAPAPAPTPAEKLAASGLTVDELKTLLSLSTADI